MDIEVKAPLSKSLKVINCKSPYISNMKKHLLILLFMVAAAFTANAQIGKGQHYAGGSFNYNYDGYGYTNNINYLTGTTVYTNNKITSLQINPDFGFFMSDKWAVGIQPGYARTSGTETSNFFSNAGAAENSTYIHKYHTDAVSLGIHFRYYWMLNDQIGIFPQFGATTAHDLNNFKSGSLTIGGNPNVVFFATPKFAVNLGFGNLAYTHDYQTKSNAFNLGLNTNISFGLNYYWGKK